MDDQLLFEELLRATEKLDIRIRIEPFEMPATSGGGLCIVRGEPLVLLDVQAPLRDRILALARALGHLESDRVYMAPQARALVEALRERASSGRIGATKYAAWSSATRIEQISSGEPR